MSKPNGGPVFPCVMPGPGHGKAGPSRIHYYGVSVRDIFALHIGSGFTYGTIEERAKWAYEHADAMLAERNK